MHDCFYLPDKLYVAYHDDDVLSTTRERVRIESTAPTDRITNLAQRKTNCHLSSSSSSSCAHHRARPATQPKDSCDWSTSVHHEIDLSYVKDVRCHDS